MKIPNLKNITLTKYESREKWLQGRHKAIGASDVSTVFGINSFTNIVELFWTKIRLTPGTPHNINSVSGEIMEPTIAKYFSHFDPENPTDEVLVQNIERNKKIRTIHRFRRNAWMNNFPLSCTLDYVSPSERAVVECKNLLGHVVNRYESGILPGHILQIQAQMLVTGLSRGILCYFVDGRFYREWVFEANGEIQEQIKERVSDFWNNQIVPARDVWNDPTKTEQEKMLLIYDNFEPDIDPNAQDSLQQFMNTRFKEISKLGKIIVNEDLSKYINGYKTNRKLEGEYSNNKDVFGSEIRSAMIANGCDEIINSDGKVIVSYRESTAGKLTLRVN
jgi:predicted phage-related endonuclease